MNQEDKTQNRAVQKSNNEIPSKEIVKKVEDNELGFSDES